MPKHNSYKKSGWVTPFISDISAKELPQFQELRGNLTRIASPAGITYLKKSSVKSSVYLGSKYHAVDINGIPWVKKTELKKITAGEKRANRSKKKLAPVETGAANSLIITVNPEQISENLSTGESQLQTVSPELSPKKRLYRVKKSLVRNRVLAYTNTKKGSKCLYFFTVTFPAGMPENMGYRCLNTWFTSLRKQRLVREYLWVAERQPNTGTIHFHIAVPHYMRVWHVNGIMRKILLGYAIRKEIPFPPEKFGRGMYNGVDIAGDKDKAGKKIPTNFAHKKKTRSLANYLTKYVTKNNETFEHLAWHNSRGFSQLFFSVALSKEQMQASGLWKKLYWEKKFEHPNGLFVFVPWFGNAPPIFWSKLNEVNNFFQNGEISHTAGMLKSQTCYHNVIKNHNDMWNKTDSFKMPAGKAEAEIANLEIQMEKAYLRYCGKCEYSKEFCSGVRLKVLERIDYIGMAKEFDSLLQLVDKEEYDPGFFYTYYLYLYWVVDLLNQIPNT